MKPLVYVAGPYTHPDPVLNVRNAIGLAEKMRRDGKVVPYVPHLTHLWHLIDPHPIEDWYALDLDVVAHCQAVVRLPGESTGADGEVTEAERLGLPVFYADADHFWRDLYGWADPQLAPFEVPE